MTRVTLVLCVLAPLALPSCGGERRAEYARECQALDDAVASVQEAQLTLLLPTAVPRDVLPQHLPLLVHAESVQDLHERSETYVDLKEQEIEAIREDMGRMRRVMALRAEVDRVRNLPWRKP